eukprot:11371729-Alexandrium_andersonii.AAC.1
MRPESYDLGVVLWGAFSSTARRFRHRLPRRSSAWAPGAQRRTPFDPGWATLVAASGRGRLVRNVSLGRSLLGDLR